ncbi:hypothetical protein FSP39_007986 [Pinctada imbricata]|uniref:Uncharacterized protein n=1 Tax=Pinctada imbricata TaxID=66713 RepID=A0AA88XVX8_PINIB|nr:hypothetical protein FSP39_007986 [Pinctada imbricata]
MLLTTYVQSTMVRDHQSYDKVSVKKGMTDLCGSLVSQATCGIFTLVILNVIFYGIYWRPMRNKDQTCSMNDVLVAATKYLQENGEISLENTIKEACTVSSLDTNKIRDLKYVLENSIYECNAKPLNYFPRHLDETILTLFTSWPSGERDKEGLHQNTIINWSAFQPRINLVLFTNDSRDEQFAKERGWTVYTIVHHFAGGAPVLRTMFETVMKNFNSTFYGYANGDILFADNMIDTLSSIYTKFSAKEDIFITGRRYNVDHVSPKEAASLPNVHTVAKTRGALFEIHSEDYFIASKSFPWDTVPDLVVGRPAYDNWIVAHARCINATVIDTTDTLTAVHQTTEKGNKESLKRATPAFNDNLILKLKLPRNYESGFITCPEWKSYETLCGAIDFYRREHLPDYCQCPKSKLS